MRKLRGDSLNGEHGKIYDRMRENHNQTIKLIMGLQKDITTVKTRVNGLPCSANTAKIELVQSRMYMGIGGIAVFTLISSVLTITKLLGFW